jgi:hypothetical protein
VRIHPQSSAPRQQRNPRARQRTGVALHARGVGVIEVKLWVLA